MKLLGMIGGMSWENTIDYYKILNQMVNDRLGDWNSAKLLLYSVNFEELLSLQNQDKWDRITMKTREISKLLEKAGCSALIICSNTMHKIADKVQETIKIPLINVIDETAKIIRQNDIKTIGLLGTNFTMEGGFYTGKLKNNYDLNPIIPNDQDRKFIHNIIYTQLAKGLILEETKQHLLTIIEDLIQADAEGIILGCTELPMIIKQENLTVPIFDTLKIHLQAAAEFCLKN